MILEGIVTTLNDDATLNIAPMGPTSTPARTWRDSSFVLIDRRRPTTI